MGVSLLCLFERKVLLGQAPNCHFSLRRNLSGNRNSRHSRTNISSTENGRRIWTTVTKWNFLKNKFQTAGQAQEMIRSFPPMLYPQAPAVFFSTHRSPLFTKNKGHVLSRTSLDFIQKYKSKEHSSPLNSIKKLNNQSNEYSIKKQSPIQGSEWWSTYCDFLVEVWLKSFPPCRSSGDSSANDWKNIFYCVFLSKKVLIHVERKSSKLRISDVEMWHLQKISFK